MKKGKLIISIFMTLAVSIYTIIWLVDKFSVSVLIVAIFLIAWIWSQKNTPIEFYFVWVFVNIAGSIVGILTGGIIAMLSLFSMDSYQAMGILGIFLALLIFSSIVGTAQWLVLRRRLINVKQWILLTILGSVIGVALIFFLSKLPASVSTDLPLYVFGSIFGVSLGAAQWFHLKRHVKQAGWWILLSAIGVTAGVWANNDFCCIDSPIGALYLFGTHAAIYAGVYAAISGIFLASAIAPRTISGMPDTNNSTL